MSDQIKRNSTREKKPPKYLQPEEDYYGAFAVSKTTDNKEGRSTLQDTTQISKILVRFLSSANQKCKDFSLQTRYDRSKIQNLSKPRIETKIDAYTNRNNRKPNELSKDNNGSDDKVLCDAQKANLKNNGKIQEQAKNKKPYSRTYVSSNQFIQSDLQYHELLHQHIKQSFPDVRSLSPEMLMKLGIPTELLEYQGSSLKKPEKMKEKKKKEFNPIQIAKNAQKQQRPDFKPFKRQSYHVAIAYHIHIKKVKESPNPNEEVLDPTCKARKLRESLDGNKGKNPK